MQPCNRERSIWYLLSSSFYQLDDFCLAFRYHRIYCPLIHTVHINFTNRIKLRLHRHDPLLVYRVYDETAFSCGCDFPRGTGREDKIKCYENENQFHSSARRFNTKFCPRYTLRTISSAASSSAVPVRSILPSNIR